MSIPIFPLTHERAPSRVTPHTKHPAELRPLLQWDIACHPKMSQAAGRPPLARFQGQTATPQKSDRLLYELRINRPGQRRKIRLFENTRISVQGANEEFHMSTRY